MDLAAVRRAYRRHAPYYDAVFGTALANSRRLTVGKVNALPGRRLLDIGIGTGLALPDYHTSKRIVGIDVSKEMLARARHRVAEHGLENVEALLDMDAERLAFADDSFDIVVAMFVAAVVPDPARLLQQIQRVCVAGGDIVIVNHFASVNGLRGQIERSLAPFAAQLGWRPDFELGPFLACGNVDVVELRDLPPLGWLTMVHCRNIK